MNDRRNLADRFESLNLPPMPEKHEWTGELLVACTNLLVRNAEAEIVQYSRPMLPRSLVPVFDEDGDAVDLRELTPDELEAATAAYEKALAEWSRTGGLFQVKGPPPIVEATFECANGDSVEAVSQPGAKRWVAVSGRWARGQKVKR